MEILKQRNSVYGNSFPEIAKCWQEYLEMEIYPQNVAALMAILKAVRMEALEIKGLQNSPEYIDSKKDYDNYKWIADHYDKYCKQFGDGKGKVAFEIEKKGYTFKATLIEPKNDALIEIFKGNNLKKEFLFPAYKIWNITAHIDDIIDGLEEESDYGLHIAGSDGLGGNCYTKQNKGGLTMSHQVKTIDCIHEKACDKIADWDGYDETIPCSGCARYVPVEQKEA